MARILADNILESADTFLSSHSADENESNLLDWRTFTLFESEATGELYLEANFSAPISADCLGICNHNLGTLGAEVSVEYSNEVDSSGAIWTQALAPFTPFNDRTIMRSFTAVNADNWRLKIDLGSSTSLSMGVLVIGESLLLPGGVQPGFDPNAETVVTEEVVSVSGHYLGALIRYFHRTAQISIQYSDATWWKDNFLPLWYNHIRHLKPFFWLWSENDDVDDSWAELMRLDSKQATLNLPYVLSYRGLTINLVGMSNIA